MNAVLKAGAAPSVELSRQLQPGALPSALVPPQPAGQWLSDHDLETLLAEAFDQGLREGQKQTEERILESARREADAAARQALHKALAERQAEAERIEAAKWQDLAASVADQLKSMRAACEAEVSEWTFIAITRLLGQVSEVQLRAAVLHVIDEAGLREPAQVLVHPKDLPVVCAEPALPPEVRLVADATVKLGGCIVRTPKQTLDARLEVQLALLREALDVARRERQGAVP